MTTQELTTEGDTRWVVDAASKAVELFWRKSNVSLIRRTYGNELQLLSYAWERIAEEISKGTIVVGKNGPNKSYAIRLGVWGCIDGLRDETKYRTLRRHGIKPPSVNELSRAGLYPDRSSLRNYSVGKRKHYGVQDPGEGPQFNSVPDLKSPSPDHQLDVVDETERMLSYAKNVHSELMETIVVLYYGLRGCEPMTMKEIGGKIGLCESRVSQLLKDYIEYVKDVKGVEE